MLWPKQVKIVEVGPRDGLQAERGAMLSVAARVKLIDLLSESGLQSLEAGSFVSSKSIPAMANSEDVFDKIQKKPGVDYAFLVPNFKGFEIAQHHGIKSISVFTAASEAFCQRNTKCSIQESFERFSEFIPLAKAQGMRVRGYVSCIFRCPYEGYIQPQKVVQVAETLLDMGCDEIAFGDTIGVGTPQDVIALLERATFPKEKMAMHFHDTYGMAIANITVSLEKGIHIFDASLSGLGGCPYAEGASGNVATEDVIYLLNGLGVDHGVNMNKLMEASAYIDGLLSRKSGSKVALALQGGCV
ncbi:Hydroxymethylglutaryl-CoA lyase [Candidatus Bealeia paramacronuclearis]|uniref:Hydroxymethylglutaryl-CoA lyase n=1 Tax=Candidatus Bealeia paramacronuclearis TaxID=1921001 RepID=A0ABZ2C808_9PROT|nr:Hydroxymethylglutaryl-CoA lyase [Candidatus Bealeia paramacronuclearis]